MPSPARTGPTGCTRPPWRRRSSGRPRRGGRRRQLGRHGRSPGREGRLGGRLARRAVIVAHLAVDERRVAQVVGRLSVAVAAGPSSPATPCPPPPWSPPPCSRADGDATALAQVATRRRPVVARANAGRTTPAIGVPGGRDPGHRGDQTPAISSAAATPSTSATGSATPSWLPKGSPAVRLITQAPIETALTPAAASHASRPGRTTTTIANASWSTPNNRNPVPSTASSPRCDGAIATWISPAPANTAARAWSASGRRGSTAEGGTSGVVSSVTPLRYATSVEPCVEILQPPRRGRRRRTCPVGGYVSPRHREAPIAAKQLPSCRGHDVHREPGGTPQSGWGWNGVMDGWPETGEDPERIRDTQSLQQTRGDSGVLRGF